MCCMKLNNVQIDRRDIVFLANDDTVEILDTESRGDISEQIRHQDITLSKEG